MVLTKYYTIKTAIDGSNTASINYFAFFPTENFYLLAAGTGITPMCKLIQSIHKFCKMNKKRRTVTLLNFNKTQKDIIWKNEFKTLEDSKDFTFKVIHIMSQEDDWNGDKGRVRKEILEKYLPTGKSDFTKFAAICGPIMFNQESNRYVV